MPIYVKYLSINLAAVRLHSRTRATCLLMQKCVHLRSVIQAMSHVPRCRPVCAQYVIKCQCTTNCCFETEYRQLNDKLASGSPHQKLFSMLDAQKKIP